MYTISIKPRGFSQLTKKYQASVVQIGAVMVSTLNAAAVLTEAEMKRRVPVDTGKLKESIRITGNVLELKAVIGPGEELLPHYAGDVEFGHHTRSGSFVPGQFFVKRTSIAVKGKIYKMFQEALNRIFV